VVTLDDLEMRGPAVEGAREPLSQPLVEFGDAAGVSSWSAERGVSNPSTSEPVPIRAAVWRVSVRSGRTASV
jgi:hypothetical protein